MPHERHPAPSGIRLALAASAALRTVTCVALLAVRPTIVPLAIVTALGAVLHALVASRSERADVLGPIAFGLEWTLHTVATTTTLGLGTTDLLSPLVVAAVFVAGCLSPGAGRSSRCRSLVALVPPLVATTLLATSPTVPLRSPQDGPSPVEIADTIFLVVAGLAAVLWTVRLLERAGLQHETAEVEDRRLVRDTGRGLREPVAGLLRLFDATRGSGSTTEELRRALREAEDLTRRMGHRVEELLSRDDTDTDGLSPDDSNPDDSEPDGRGAVGRVARSSLADTP